jgi:SpoVK/Ycf46/Vps4 family AAA+-type ATPase
VYLPTHAERQEIFGDPPETAAATEQFDLDQLAKQSEGYTGADIKEVVQLGLKLAFHAGEELTNDHLAAAIPRFGRCRRPIPSRSPRSPSGSTATPSRPATATTHPSAQRQRPQAARDRLIPKSRFNNL